MDIQLKLAATIASVAVTTLLIVGKAAHLVFFHPLAKYPGPWIARFSNAYAAYHGWKGDIHLDMWRCHQKYGLQDIAISALDSCSSLIPFHRGLCSLWAEPPPDQHRRGPPRHLRQRIYFQDCQVRRVQAVGASSPEHVHDPRRQGTRSSQAYHGPGCLREGPERL